MESGNVKPQPQPQPQPVQPSAQPLAQPLGKPAAARPIGLPPKPAPVHTNPTTLVNHDYLSTRKVKQYVTFLTATMSQQYCLSTGKRPHSSKKKGPPSPHLEAISEQLRPRILEQENLKAIPGRILRGNEMPELQSAMKALPKGHPVVVLQPAANDLLQPHTVVAVTHPETGGFAVHFSIPAGPPVPRSALPPPPVAGILPIPSVAGSLPPPQVVKTLPPPPSVPPPPAGDTVPFPPASRSSPSPPVGHTPPVGQARDADTQAGAKTAAPVPGEGDGDVSEDEPLAKRQKSARGVASKSSGPAVPAPPPAMELHYVPFQRDNRLCLYPLNLPKAPAATPPLPAASGGASRGAHAAPPQPPQPGLVLSELAKSLGAKVKKVMPQTGAPPGPPNKGTGSLNNTPPGGAQPTSPFSHSIALVVRPAEAKKKPPKRTVSASGAYHSDDVEARTVNNGPSAQNASTPLRPVRQGVEAPRGGSRGPGNGAAIPGPGLRVEKVPQWTAAGVNRPRWHPGPVVTGGPPALPRLLPRLQNLPGGVLPYEPGQQSRLKHVAKDASALVLQASKNLQSFLDDTEPEYKSAHKQGRRLIAVQESLIALEELCKSLAG